MQLNQQLRKKLTNVISQNTKGKFHDESWEPITNLINNLKDAGNALDLEVSLETSYYKENDKSQPTSKTWILSASEMNLPRTSYIFIQAQAAGTVSYPLGAYDIVAYVT